MRGGRSDDRRPLSVWTRQESASHKRVLDMGPYLPKTVLLLSPLPSEAAGMTAPVHLPPGWTPLVFLLGVVCTLVLVSVPWIVFLALWPLSPWLAWLVGGGLGLVWLVYGLVAVAFLIWPGLWPPDA